MDETTLKWVSVGVVLVVGALGALVPLWMSRDQPGDKPGGQERLWCGMRGQDLFSRANVLSGGVFLTAGVLHMLPDSASAFQDYFGDDNASRVAQYPWWAFMCLWGVLILLLMSYIAKAVKGKARSAVVFFFFCGKQQVKKTPSAACSGSDAGSGKGTHSAIWRSPNAKASPT